MLPAHIIEELLRRERAQESSVDQPRLELPLPTRRPREIEEMSHDDTRGVLIVQIWD